MPRLGVPMVGEGMLLSIVWVLRARFGVPMVRNMGGPRLGVPMVRRGMGGPMNVLPMIPSRVDEGLRGDMVLGMMMPKVGERDVMLSRVNEGPRV